MTNSVMKYACAAALAIGVIAPLVWSGPPADAHMGAKGVVKERMDVMKNMGAALKSIQAGIKVRPEIDRTAVSTAVRTIAQHADRTLLLFPKGSESPPSEARPEIWQDWDSFRAANNSLKVEAENLAKIAQNGDRRAVTAQFARTVRACSQCHQRFRRTRR